VANPTLGQENVFWKGMDNNLWEAYCCNSDRIWRGPFFLGMGPLG
jgi:hypothetical protein